MFQLNYICSTADWKLSFMLQLSTMNLKWEEEPTWLHQISTELNCTWKHYWSWFNHTPISLKKKHRNTKKSTMFLMIHQTGTNCTADGEVFDPIMVGWCRSAGEVRRRGAECMWWVMGRGGGLIVAQILNITDISTQTPALGEPEYNCFKRKLP